MEMDLTSLFIIQTKEPAILTYLNGNFSENPRRGKKRKNKKRKKIKQQKRKKIKQQKRKKIKQQKRKKIKYQKSQGLKFQKRLKKKV